LLAARAVVVVFTVVLLVMYLRWVPRWLDLRAAEAADAARSGDGFAYFAASRIATTAALLSAAAWAALGALIFLKRSRDLQGALLAVSFVSLGVMMTDIAVIVPMARTDAWAPWPAVVFLVANAFGLPWVYVFPDGRFVPRWTMVLALAWIAWSAIRMVTPEADQARLGWPGIVLNAAFQVSMIGAFAWRYWTTPDAVQRQQIKWLVVAGLIGIIAVLAALPPRLLIGDFAEGGRAFVARTATAAFLALAVTAFPLTLAAAIFRQGLLNISLLINRTLAYMALTLTLVAGFVTLGWAAVRASATLWQGPSDVALLAAAVPIALAFMPARARLLRFADRYVSDRTVRMLLFVDVVESTSLAVSLGDRRWRERLEAFRAMVRRNLARFGGQEVDTAGDGFFAAFEGPDRVLACAAAIAAAAPALELQVRCGAHVGEVEVHGEHVTGVAVHVAARVMAAAAPGEVLVSLALRDLVAGSALRLEPRGSFSLRGVPGDWTLFALAAMT
jgi:class 3 adenylate cyclase